MTKFAVRRNDQYDTVSCNGLNHNDSARRGRCLHCGREIAKRDDGRLYDVRHQSTESGLERTFYRCYERIHACDPELAALHQAAHQRDLDAGHIVHGQHVTVVRGRKVPKGTTGTVFYAAQDTDYTGNPYTRVGIRTQEGTTFFLTSEYLRATQPPTIGS
ncbi:hypothetical protein [Nocardia sp. NPDC057030]|uniref:hypothetical protein n=1 Tax=unclassified Nocardia TaxID=2637762 RepID=UPI00362EEEF6